MVLFALLLPVLPYCLLPLPGELVLFFFFFFRGREERKEGNQRFCPREGGKGDIGEGAEAGKLKVILL